MRLFPSRTKAAAACRAGHVKIDGESVPPSHKVTPGMHVRITGPGGRVRIVEIVRVISKRVGAPEAVKCYLDHSPPPPPKEVLASIPTRERGAGRPTKKDRREIDRLRGRAD